MREESETRQAMERYSNLVWRICYLYLKHTADAEDVFQNVFMKYILFSGTFESEEHKKAWLIRVTTNCCKDYLKSFFHKHTIYLEDYSNKNLPSEFIYETQTENPVLTALKTLPDRYRMVLYLTYYEGYTAAEIGTILHKKENTIYTWISRGKKLLKEVLLSEGYRY